MKILVTLPYFAHKSVATLPSERRNSNSHTAYLLIAYNFNYLYIVSTLRKAFYD